MKDYVLSNREIALFCQSLSQLLHAGISLGDGLFLLAEEEAGAFQELLEMMGRQTDSGCTFAQVVESSTCFPGYVTGMIQVGERTGRLEETLQALASYYEKQERMERQIRNALTYPAVLMLLMLGIIVVLLVKVLPVFDEVYASLGGSLTGTAGGLLYLGQILKAGMPILAILLAAAMLFLLLFSGNERFRKNILGIWRMHFGDKGVSRKLHDAHFAEALAMGLRSGLTLEEAVKLAGTILKDVPAAAARCRACTERLSEGESLSNVFRESSMLPAYACRMLELGIRSGNGDTVMEKIAERLSEEADQALEQKVSQIEPAMVLMASVLVGAILFSVMLPLMNIMSAIG